MPAMNETQSGQVTRLLPRVAEGDTEALNQVVELIHPQLLDVASRISAHKPMSPEEVVNEVYLRFYQSTCEAPVNRAQFLALAARRMRWIVLNQWRKGSAGRECSWPTLSLGGATLTPERELELERLLEELEAADADANLYVTAKYFGGMTDAEIRSAVPELKGRTALEKAKRFARAWLQL